MNLVGLDLNSGRARAVAGPAGRAPGLVYLEGDRVELSLAISLEDRVPRVGKAGFALMRARPHLVCSDFLPALGSKQTWGSNKHRLDPDFYRFGRPCKTLLFVLVVFIGEERRRRIEILWLAWLFVRHGVRLPVVQACRGDCQQVVSLEGIQRGGRRVRGPSSLAPSAP